LSLEPFDYDETNFLSSEAALGLAAPDISICSPLSFPGD
jgi:hypothetical protein